MRGLTCDNSIVGRFQHGSIKLNDVLMTQDTKNLSLDEEKGKVTPVTPLMTSAGKYEP